MPYLHSNLALSTMKSLIKGILSLDTPSFSGKIIGKDDLVHRLIFTMTFRMPQPVPGVQRYYSDLSTLGKHYVVFNSLFPEKKRQYTICNCMEKTVHAEYIRIIETFKTIMRLNQIPSPFGKTSPWKKSGNKIHTINNAN